MSSLNSMIEAVRDFVQTCDMLDGKRVNVDYIGEEMSYSVDPLPCEPVVQRYVDGGAKKQFQFAFTSKEAYDEDGRVTIENSGFYEAFDAWLETKSMKGDLPELPSGRRAIRFETLNSGYLYDVDGNMARYQIECRLIYLQEV